MAECFCGCGRSVAFSVRPRAWNAGAKLISDQLGKLRAARSRELTVEQREELDDTIAAGEFCVDTYRGLLHGEVSRNRVKDKLKSSGMRYKKQAESLLEVGGVAGPDVELVGINTFGFNADDVTELWDGGAHAPGTVIGVRFTGRTVNQNPHVVVTVRVEPAGEPSFDIQHKLFVSLVNPPRRGEPVEVAYDPADHGRSTFRKSDLTDAGPNAPASDPMRQLEQLAELHRAGALTAEEFEAQKAKVLERM